MRRAQGLLAPGLALALAGCGAGDDVAIGKGPGVAAEVRPDTPGNNLQFNFDSGDVVESFGSSDGRFLVHFTRNGPNAVPAADTDSSGVPDFVEQVASVYVEVLAHYETTLGFRAPLDDGAIADNGGDDRFDVYLVDFAGVGDGNYRDDACGPGNQDQCAGYMVEENDFAGYGYPSTLVANRILGSHEFFHAVQSAYDNGQGSIMAEGSAVWATESFDPSLNDFEYFLDGYLDNPDRPLDKPLPGPVDPFSYGSAIFFQFLEEHYGPGTVRSLWERCEDGANGVADPVWLTEIDPLLAAQDGASFAEAMDDFATWNLFTSSFSDPARSYAKGNQYLRVRIDPVTAPYSEDALRVYYASSQYFGADPGTRAAMTAALVPPASDPGAADGLMLHLAVERGSDLDPVVDVVDPTAGTETIDTNGADRLVVLVVNGAVSGDSKKPGLCIGTVDEVAACKAALGQSGAGGAGGGGGAGGAGGSGTGEGGQTPASQPPAEEESGCGCRVPAAPASERAGVVALALAALLARRRRRSPT